MKKRIENVKCSEKYCKNEATKRVYDYVNCVFVDICESCFEQIEKQKDIFNKIMNKG